MQARKEFDSDKDGNVTPEEVLEQTKFSASSADLDEFVTSIWPEIKDKYSPPHPEEAEPVPPPPTEEPSAPGLQDDNEEDDDADFEEVCAFCIDVLMCVQYCRLDQCKQGHGRGVKLPQIWSYFLPILYFQ